MQLVQALLRRSRACVECVVIAWNWLITLTTTTMKNIHFSAYQSIAAAGFCQYLILIQFQFQILTAKVNGTHPGRGAASCLAYQHQKDMVSTHKIPLTNYKMPLCPFLRMKSGHFLKLNLWPYPTYCTFLIKPYLSLQFIFTVWNYAAAGRHKKTNKPSFNYSDCSGHFVPHPLKLFAFSHLQASS